MTFAPRILPIWHANDPTEPAAPETTSVSPALIFATSNRPYHATVMADGRVVKPVHIRSTPVNPLEWLGQSMTTGNAARVRYIPEMLKVPKKSSNSAPGGMLANVSQAVCQPGT